MKRSATILLLLIAIVFVLSFHWSTQYPWLTWVVAFAEAGTVGALADWFAVTALFRHPLGIPIPHTAIVKKNQARIADTLGEFIETNFLTPELIRERLERLQPLRFLSDWLLGKDRLRGVSIECATIVIRALQTMGEERIVLELAAWLKGATKQSAVFGKALGGLLETLVYADQQGVLFERAVHYAEDTLRNHGEFLREHIRKELPWYIPRFVHEKVYHLVIDKLELYFREIKTAPNHPAREQFRAYLFRLAHEVTNNPRTQEKLTHWIHGVLGDETIVQYVRTVWVKVTQAIATDIALGNSSEVIHLVEGLAKHLLQVIATDSELSKRADEVVRDILFTVIERNRANVGRFISETMKTWDSEVLSAKIEEKIGADLQYVRINGTIVGGLVGVTLELLKRLLA